MLQRHPIGRRCHGLHIFALRCAIPIPTQLRTDAAIIAPTRSKPHTSPFPDADWNGTVKVALTAASKSADSHTCRPVPPNEHGNAASPNPAGTSAVGENLSTTANATTDKTTKPAPASPITLIGDVKLTQRPSAVHRQARAGQQRADLLPTGFPALSPGARRAARPSPARPGLCGPGTGAPARGRSR